MKRETKQQTMTNADVGRRYGEGFVVWRETGGSTVFAVPGEERRKGGHDNATVEEERQETRGERRE